jgi:23S rRNA (adenine2503-C2)-methyltransferase
VNLIPFNEFSGTAFRRPDDLAVQQFQTVLRRAGVDVFIRKSKGRDILGACGQLGNLPRRQPALLIPASAQC